MPQSPLEFTNTDFEPDFTSSERTVLRRISQMILDSVALDLNDLEDVDADLPDDGDVLTWNNTAGVWEPQPAGSGSGVTLGAYSPTIVEELNASGPTTGAVSSWIYSTDGIHVISFMNVVIDSNGGSDANGEVSFDLPTSPPSGYELETSSLTGSCTGLSAGNVSVVGKINWDNLYTTGSDGPLIHAYLPSGVSTIRLAGAFQYRYVLSGS